MSSVNISKRFLSHHKSSNPWALIFLLQKLLISFVLCTSACAPKRQQIFYPPNSHLPGAQPQIQDPHQPQAQTTTSTEPILEVGHIPPLPPITPEDEKLGHEVLGQLSEKYKLDFNHPRRAEVDDVVKKITEPIGGSSQPWHVNVFADSKVKNAAATRGNNIFIWTGMIDATQNESELAAVLSHEVAHILARHTEPSSGESTREFIVGLGAMVAGTAVGILTNGAIGSDIASQLASSLTKEVGAGILIYPYTRDKELEADEIGLFLMHKAGYDPKYAINFWKRASQDPDFSSSVPFFSTHPPAADRLERLANLIPVIEKMNSTKNPINNTPANNAPANNAPAKTPPPITSGSNMTKPKPQNTPTQAIPSPQPSPNSGNSQGVLSPGDSFDIRK